MSTVDSFHDNFCRAILANEENARSFLKITLPKRMLRLLDLSKIKIDMTGYVADELKSSFCDIVVKTVMKSTDNGALDTDIYFLFEHKSYRDPKVFLQLLKYMHHIWQKDSDDKKPLRAIIPIVFYHGEKSWGLPCSFSEQFKVDDAIKEFLLDYRFILFDTNAWDFEAPGNEALADNVYLLTGLLLLKSAFHEDVETIRKVFEFWHKSGLSKDKEGLLLFLSYIVSTRDISAEEIGKMLQETKINGGDIMPTLAQRWVDQGKQEGLEVGLKEGKQVGLKEGEKRRNIEIARKSLREGLSIELVARLTGLSREEIDKLAVRG